MEIIEMDTVSRRSESLIDNKPSAQLIKTSSDPHLSQLETEIKGLRDQLFQLTEKINNTDTQLKKKVTSDNDATLKEEANKVIQCFEKLAIATSEVEQATDKTGNGILGAEKGSCSVFIVTALDISCYVISVMAFIADAVSESNKSSSEATKAPGTHSKNPWVIVKFTFGAIALILTALTGLLTWWYKKNKNKFKKLSEFDHSEVEQLNKIRPFVESIKVAAEKKDEESIKKCLKEYHKVDASTRLKLLPALEKFLVTAIELFPEEHSTRKLLEQIDRLAKQKIVEISKPNLKEINLKKPKRKAFKINLTIPPIDEDDELKDVKKQSPSNVSNPKALSLDKIKKKQRNKSWSNDFDNSFQPPKTSFSFENASSYDKEEREEDSNEEEENLHESMSLCFKQLQEQLGLEEPITAINLGKKVVYNPKNIVITANDIEQKFFDPKKQSLDNDKESFEVIEN